MKEKNDSAQSPERLGFGQFVDKVFYAIVTAAAVFISHEMDKLTTSIFELNKNFAVMMEHVANQDHRLDAHDHRIEQLEVKKKE